MMDWISVVREIGILAAACGFFIWTSWLREDRMSKRISELEKFVEGQLMTLIGQQSSALEKCSASMIQSANAMEGLMEAALQVEKQSERVLCAIQLRPCLLPENHPMRIRAAEELKKEMEKQGYVSK